MRLPDVKAEGQSVRKIATALGRPPSTIAREVKRNSGRKVGYKPEYANEQTKARRRTGSKLARNAELHADVFRQLARGVSPEQIAGRIVGRAPQPRGSVTSTCN